MSHTTDYEIQRRYFTVQEIADELGLDTGTVLKRARDRKIRVRLGTPSKIDVRDLDKLK